MSDQNLNSEEKEAQNILHDLDQEVAHLPKKHRTSLQTYIASLQNLLIAENRNALDSLLNELPELQVLYKLLDTLPVMVGIADIEQENIIIIYGNSAFARLLDLPGDFISNYTSEDWVTAFEETRIWLEHYRKAQRTGETEHFEYQRPGSSPESWMSASVTYLATGSLNRPRFSFIIEDITERKKAESALRESEERFRNLVEPFSQAVWESDAEGRIVKDSPSWRKYTGQTQEELFGNGWVNAVHPDDRNFALNEWEKAIRYQTPVDTVFRLKSPEGGWRWTNVRAAPLRGIDGEIIKWVGMNIDVTDEKIIEEKLKKNQEKQAFLLKLADIVGAIDNVSEMLEVTSRLLGEQINAERVLYGEFHDDEGIVMIHPDYYPEGKNSLAGVYPINAFGETHPTLKLGKTLVISDIESTPILSEMTKNTYRALNIPSFVAIPMVKNNRVIWTLNVVSNTPRNWTAEEVGIVEEVGKRTWDAVERARAQRDLRASEERFRVTVESLNEGVSIFSPIFGSSGEIIDLRYEYINQAGCRILRAPRENIVGRRILDLFPQLPETGLFQKYLQVIQSGNPLIDQFFAAEEIDEAPFEIDHIYQIYAARFQDGLIVTSTDISKITLLEAERQEAIKQREMHFHLTEMREEDRRKVARDIHDGPIQSLVTLLFDAQVMRGKLTDPKVNDFIDQMDENVKKVVDDLRQVVNELRPPAVIRFGLARTIKVYTNELKGRHPEIEWQLDLEEGGNPLPESMTLILFRIFQETVLNIVRHAEATEAWVLYRVAQDHVYLRIQDNGKGLPDNQNLSELTLNKHYGLAGIIERVEALHGITEIISKSGAGTEISIRVPI